MKTSPKLQTLKFASKQKIEWESELFDKKKKSNFWESQWSVNHSQWLVGLWTKRVEAKREKLLMEEFFCSVEFIYDDLLNE